MSTSFDIFFLRFHGSGTLNFENGSKYVGQWEKGLAVEVGLKIAIMLNMITVWVGY